MALSGKKSSPADSLAMISNVLLGAAIVLSLYFGRELLVPLALAGLLTFMLAPVVTRLQRWIGRVAAVLAVVAMIFAVAGGAGWILTRETVQLANSLPNYKENIRTKLHAIHVPNTGPMARISRTWEELKQDLPGKKADENVDENVAKVEVINGPDRRLELLQVVLAPVVGPLGTAALVLLLLIFMLMQREDIRNRLIRLIGQGRIGATTRAMDDAAMRVSRYLRMQLVVNVTYGIALAIGLYFIDVPNAMLWGALATILRFIPYLGPWIAAAFPVVVSLAVSPDWMMPLMTVALFVVIELISNNVMEPWLYGSSTGVSPIALIVAALVWTWLWGPVGLVLATPLTVCLVVMGRHIPRLAFLSILLSDEEALTPAQECYHRLQRAGEHDDMDLVDGFLKTNSTEALFDTMLIPVIGIAETDYRLGMLEDSQLEMVEQGISDILDDLGVRPSNKDDDTDHAPLFTRICCVPAKAYRDELAGEMMAQAAVRLGCEVLNGSSKLLYGEVIAWIQEIKPQLVCVSAVRPTTLRHVRYVCTKLRQNFPELRLLIGLWDEDSPDAETMRSLRDAGADAVVNSVTAASEWLRGQNAA